MAVQVLPLIIGAARALAVVGRGAYAGGRAAAVRAGLTRGAARGASRRAAQRVTEPWMGRRISYEQAQENVRNFYQLARRRFGTPRPTPAQYHQFAQEIGDEQRRRENQQVHQEATTSLGDLAKKAALVASGFVVLRATMRDYSQQAIQRGNQLRTFDSRIGMAMARYDVGELRRTYREAAETGGTTSALIDARRQRQDAWQPITSQLENFGNIGRVLWTRGQAFIGRFLDKIGTDELMEKLNEKLAKLLEIEMNRENGENESQRMFKVWLRESGQMPRNRPPNGAPPNGGPA